MSTRKSDTGVSKCASVPMGQKGWMLMRLLAALALLPALAIAGGKVDEGPLSLRLVAEVGQTGVLRFATEHYSVTKPYSDASVESVTTGFELSFDATVPSAGRVQVDLDLTLTFPGGTGGVEQRVVVGAFEVASGESMLIPETPNGPAIVATPTIVSGSVGEPKVLLDLAVPVGGQLVALPKQRAVHELRLVGAEGPGNTVRQAIGHSFLTGVTAGEAVLSSAESGVGLGVAIGIDGTTAIQLGMEFDYDFVDEPVATKTVRIDGLLQDLQLPVARSLTVQTAGAFVPGETMVLARITAGAPIGSEFIVSATPRLIEDAPLPLALVEARVAMVGGGGDLQPVDGATARTQSQKRYSTAATEPNSGLLSQSTEQSFLMGEREGEPVMLSLQSDTVLRFSPTALAEDELALQVLAASVGFAPASPQYPLVTLKGEKLIHLPETRIFALQSAVALDDGGTIAVAGGLSQRELHKSREQLEWLFLGTAGALDDGSVLFDGRLVEAAEHTAASKKASSDTEHTVSEVLQCLEVSAAP